MKEEKNLHGKWWGRILIVFYVLFWLFAFSVVSFIAYSQRTHKETDIWKISINCANPKNSFWENDYGDKIINNPLTVDEESLYRKECQYGINKDDYTKYPEVTTKNFTITPYYNTVGNTNSAWLTFFLGLIISFIIIEAIKSILLYILGYSLLRGVPKWIWILKWFVVGSLIAVVFEPLLGVTHYYIVWAIFIVIGIGYELLKKYRKKKTI